MENIDLTIYENSGFSTIFTVTDSADQPIELSGYDLDLVFYDDLGTTVLVSYSETDIDKLFLTGTIGEVQLLIDNIETAKLANGNYTLTIHDGVIPVQIVAGYVFFIKQDKSNLEFLLPFVRLKIGDTNPAAYRYTDEWIQKAMILGMKNLQRYWNYKYLIDADDVISRNPYAAQFISPEPPIIETGDEYIIVLMTAIIMLEGSLENSAWDVSSWSDAEIRYTNIDSGRMREGHLQRLLNELNDLILPPTKRLARARKSSLPGYHNNPFEQKTEL